jgi:hypothetical protein
MFFSSQISTICWTIKQVTENFKVLESYVEYAYGMKFKINKDNLFEHF